jgi:SAM-dependent methyltransferase
MSKPVSFWATLPPVSAIPYNHWELPRIMADADARTPGGGLWNWLELLNPGTVYKSAISLGCGSGLKELALLEHGIVEKIRACDISRERCDKAKATAAEKNLQNRFEVKCADAATFIANTSTTYDFIHWDNSLHHMGDVHKAIKWSWSVLNSGGCFYMNEYVGSNRFQWTVAELKAANHIRSLFPEAWFKDKGKQTWCSERLVQSPPLYMVDADEAPASADIGRCVAELIPDVRYAITGGMGYYVAMSGLWSSIKPDSDSQHIGKMLALDKAYADVGMFSYACALAIKK